MTKTFWCVFRFTVPTVVHLQNANAKFHKVVQRHYSDELENVYISVRQIYSGTKFYQNRSGFVEDMIKTTYFGVFFRSTVYMASAY